MRLDVLTSFSGTGEVEIQRDIQRLSGNWS
jgi:hypothetical protein